MNYDPITVHELHTMVLRYTNFDCLVYIRTTNYYHCCCCWNRAVETLRRYQNVDGGFGGGFQQVSHLAPTYAAVNALVTVGTRESLELVDR